MRVFIDIGNSGAKWSWQSEASYGTASMSPTQRLDHRTPPTFSEEFQKEPAPRTWLVSTVHRPAGEWLVHWIEQTFPADRICPVQREQIPVEKQLTQPETVGLDRLLAALAVNQLRTVHAPAVYCDFGTATTCNAVDRDGRFLGGAILPGIQTQLNALTNATDQLPALRISDDHELPELIGKNTRDAIVSGVCRAHSYGTAIIINEMKRVLTEEGLPEPEVFLTGGGIPQPTDYWPESAKVVPQLVLYGLALLAESLEL